MEPLCHDNKTKMIAVNVGGKSGITKRQISRELFVNQDVGVGDDDNRGRNSRQLRKFFPDSSFNVDAPSPQVGSENPITQFTSTPSNTSTTTIRGNKSLEMPTNTSTPNSSFFNTKNSLSFDQSSMVNRGGHGSSSRRSFDAKNNSTGRRNTSSPFCLGDFLSTSNASNTSGRGGHKSKRNQSSTTAESTPKFNSFDFPALTDEPTTAKPKKRVMPITVSRRVSTDSPIFISSSFHSDNNLLNVTTLEADESVNILPERAILREHRDTITKDFTAEHTPTRNLHALIRETLPASPLSATGQNILASTPHKSAAMAYDEGQVERQDVLVAMARIYSFLIDANHVPNILSEFSYIVNLLNTECNPYERQTQNYSQMKSSIDVASCVLKHFHNCIFFAVCILSHQKQILGMLDCTTIRVICDYERIQTSAPNVYEYLRNVVHRKMQIDSLSTQRVRSDANNINKVVFYQQETDNRDNFPSDREFGVFKKQRDMFYAILR